jgi:hypothetical protein
MPKHYRLDVRSIAEGNLDQLYKDGWRVIQMTAHTDGEHVILLLEKVAHPQKK